jgi:putative membrane protein
MLIRKQIPLSYILKNVKYDIIRTILIGLTFHYLTFFYNHLLPEIPFSIPAFLGTSISVLLSFKLNQSYDRWWEARRVWGEIVNDSRNLVLQLQSFTTGENNVQIKAIAYRQIAWCYALGQSLRGLDATENLSSFLTEKEIEAVNKHNNKPLAILQLNSKNIAQLHAENKLDVHSKLIIDLTSARLCDAMGKSERINNTVFPTSYRIFLHFMIYLFTITLSLALSNMDVWFEIPLLTLLALSFFLLEKSADHIQDPFKNRPNDIPITSIARTIEINIRQLLGETEVPKAVTAHDYYIL